MSESRAIAKVYGSGGGPRPPRRSRSRTSRASPWSGRSAARGADGHRRRPTGDLLGSAGADVQGRPEDAAAPEPVAHADRLRLRRRDLGRRPRRGRGPSRRHGAAAQQPARLLPGRRADRVQAGSTTATTWTSTSKARRRRRGPAHHASPRPRRGGRLDARTAPEAALPLVALHAARPLPGLFTVPLAGGLPEQLPLPSSGHEDALSPDGARLAYIPHGAVRQLRRGRSIAADRRRRSGSPTCPTRTSRRSRAPTPTTATRCGSATRSTSSPTATAQADAVRLRHEERRGARASSAQPRRLRRSLCIIGPRRDCLRAARRAAPLRPRLEQAPRAPCRSASPGRSAPSAASLRARRGTPTGAERGAVARPASASSWRRAARSSRCPPRRATRATSRGAPAWPTATPRGLPTGSGSPGSRTRRASTRSTSAPPTGSGR